MFWSHILLIFFTFLSNFQVLAFPIRADLEPSSPSEESIDNTLLARSGEDSVPEEPPPPLPLSQWSSSDESKDEVEEEGEEGESEDYTRHDPAQPTLLPNNEGDIFSKEEGFEVSSPTWNEANFGSDLNINMEYGLDDFMSPKVKQALATDLGGLFIGMTALGAMFLLFPNGVVAKWAGENVDVIYEGSKRIITGTFIKIAKDYFNQAKGTITKRITSCFHQCDLKTRSCIYSQECLEDDYKLFKLPMKETPLEFYIGDDTQKISLLEKQNSTYLSGLAHY